MVLFRRESRGGERENASGFFLLRRGLVLSFLLTFYEMRILKKCGEKRRRNATTSKKRVDVKIVSRKEKSSLSLSLSLSLSGDDE